MVPEPKLPAEAAVVDVASGDWKQAEGAGKEKSRTKTLLHEAKQKIEHLFGIRQDSTPAPASAPAATQDSQKPLVASITEHPTEPASEGPVHKIVRSVRLWLLPGREGELRARVFLVRVSVRGCAH